MVHWVDEQYDAGHTIIVWTARPWDAANQTVARLTEWGVEWHGIRMEKGYADMSVDDKGTTPREQLLDGDYDGDSEGSDDPSGNRTASGDGELDVNERDGPDGGVTVDGETSAGDSEVEASAESDGAVPGED
ncbi:hypothetical protein [Halomarina oriensis]|uniref:hypothetical protein n=1 Tax=Halomarina oriensis TaxID=671145 RepID=UPI0018EF0E23|nr:hypothetical protein [Halomarina oriensis]